MAKATKVGVEISKKVNLGNYQSATVGVSVWVDVGEGEKVEAVISYGQRICREKLAEEVQRLYTPDPTSVSVDHHQR